tara:strand:+ start:333 stop:947 length:615 start_codon:yes stop_codon:yes gene_type:complete
MIKNKLETINNLLKSNQKVVMGRREEYDSFFREEFFEWFHLNSYEKSGKIKVQEVRFPIAPKKPLYNIEELNQFKDSLLPSLKLSNTHFDWLIKNSAINNGKLECSEVIATEKAYCNRDITLKEKDLIINYPILKTFTNNKRNLEHNRNFKYMRDIKVFVFPHKAFLKIYSDIGVGRDYISINHHEFAHRHPKIVKKLIDANKI